MRAGGNGMDLYQCNTNSHTNTAIRIVVFVCSKGKPRWAIRYRRHADYSIPPHDTAQRISRIEHLYSLIHVYFNIIYSCIRRLCEMGFRLSMERPDRRF